MKEKNRGQAKDVSHEKTPLTFSAMTADERNYAGLFLHVAFPFSLDGFYR